MPLDRRSSLLLKALLLLDGAQRLVHGLEPTSGYGFPTLVGEPVGAVFYLLKRAVDLPEAALGLLAYGGVHLAGEHRLTHIPGVVLRKVSFALAEISLVLGHALAYAHQFVAQAYQPLSLVFYELLVYLIVLHGFYLSVCSDRLMGDAAYVYPNSLPGTRGISDYSVAEATRRGLESAGGCGGRTDPDPHRTPRLDGGQGLSGRFRLLPE